MKYGLKDKYISELTDILRRIPDIERVVLYGSRARGDYYYGSDIDICLYGDKITDRDLTHISTMLYDSRIPYFFDVVVSSRLRNEAFIRDIQRDGVEIYNASTAANA